jgi:uncharacterized protein (DUF885 family)
MKFTASWTVRHHPARRALAPAIGLTSLVLQSSCARDTASTSASADDRRRQLDSLFDEQWQYTLRTNPEWATALGDLRYNDRLDDRSPEFYQSDIEDKSRMLARFQAFDAKGLPPQDTLSRALMIRELRLDTAGARFKEWEMPVDPRNGLHVSLPELVALTPFNTVRDYDNYVARLCQVPRAFRQVIANMRQGMRDSLVPPRYMLGKVATEADNIAGRTGENSPFAKPLKSFPTGVAAADQKRLRQAIFAAIADSIVPAYRAFATFVRNEYAPRGRVDPGIWSLPDGGARYRYAIRRFTTTDMTPAEIHALGVRELDQVNAEMLAIANKLGFKDLASLNQHIKSERSFYANSGQQVLDLYTAYTASMEPELPKLFGRLPKSKLIVIPMEAARAPNDVPADYTDGTADGSRPGHINVNEWDPSHRLKLNIEAIAYHEGIPGHHLQISLAQEMQDLPEFRRHAGYTAFVEGWALYAERLGKDVGHYKDPYSDYGRLENEMWRVIRLIIDTGVHDMRWPRDSMVAYFHRYTAMDEPNVQSEVDRYIAWPGQALAYKLGQLEILKLRDTAKRTLGDKFDIRAFHDQVLGNGALPLDVLDAEVTSWINGAGGAH